MKCSTILGASLLSFAKKYGREIDEQTLSKLNPYRDTYKKCPICGERFLENYGQKYCSVECRKINASYRLNKCSEAFKYTGIMLEKYDKFKRRLDNEL